MNNVVSSVCLLLQNLNSVPNVSVPYSKAMKQLILPRCANIHHNLVMLVNVYGTSFSVLSLVDRRPCIRYEICRLIGCLSKLFAICINSKLLTVCQINLLFVKITYFFVKINFYLSKLLTICQNNLLFVKVTLLTVCENYWRFVKIT